MSEARALGGISLAADDVQTGAGSKLATLREGTDDDHTWMLTAYCFDLARKLEYVYKAAREFAAFADPALAREIRTDNQAIGEAATWRARAEAAEEILIRIRSEIGDEHHALLDQVAG